MARMIAWLHQFRRLRVRRKKSSHLFQDFRHLACMLLLLRRVFAIVSNCLPMSRKSKPIDRLLSLMSRLRSPRGCPWDREQTHKTIKQNLVEECYEAIDAIEAG